MFLKMDVFYNFSWSTFFISNILEETCEAIVNLLKYFKMGIPPFNATYQV